MPALFFGMLFGLVLVLAQPWNGSPHPLGEATPYTEAEMDALLAPMLRSMLR